MSDIKCPFCQQELVKDTPFAWNCPNEECVETDMMWGTANMWQELIRTRKALDVAVDALKAIKDGKTPVSLGISMDINDALEQITGIYCCRSSFLSCQVGLGNGAFGTKELWQALIDTKKKLDLAIKAMKISNEIVYSAYGSPLKTLKDALEQINNKEVK